MSNVKDIEFDEGGIMCSGPLGTAIYAATVLQKGIELYAKSGLKVNKAYTPGAMIASARYITGEPIRARDYAGAVAALDRWLHVRRLLVRLRQEHPGIAFVFKRPDGSYLSFVETLSGTTVEEIDLAAHVTKAALSGIKVAIVEETT